MRADIGKLTVLGTIGENDIDDRILSSSSSSSSDASALAYEPFDSNEEDSSDKNDVDVHEPNSTDADQEQKRLEYFIRCFELVRTIDQDGEKIIAEDSKEEENNSELQVEGSQQCRPKTNSLSLASDALFNDPTVLKALRLSLNCPGGLAEGLDPTIALYIKLFEFAQMQRHKKYGIRPYGVFGLFRNLSDIRSDLLWAQDAIHRRQTNKPYVSWADYYRKENSTLTFPYFTVFLIVISLIMMILAFDRNKWNVEPLNVNPLIGPTPEVLLGLGALEGKLMVETQQWWRLVTPMFLHGGIIHLVINLACIAVLGKCIERSHGFLRTGALFTISAVGGNMVSVLMQPGYVLVGASGGIFGLMGLCVADIILNWRLLFLIFDQRPDVIAGRLQMMDKEEDNGNGRGKKCWCYPNNYNFCTRFVCGLFLCLDILLNSAVGFTPLVDNFAHLGGLFYGFLFSLSSLKQLPLGFIDHAQQNAPVLLLCHKMRQLFLRFFGTVCAAMLLMVSAVLVSQSTGQHSPCLSCRYISCIPFPFWVSEEKRWWSCDICRGVYAAIYKWEDQTYYGKLEMYCPQGYVKDVDIFDMQYQDFSVLEDDLESICQRECE
ncbi:rhomboid family protein [Nitzschia inconspicua]|uniref:rhomboid protease n=1 Tax=Nitzschia inconspicua TaxID=303405 RepID=A0A9K3M5T2_9STRA|nr:rhomboid family protein [Nitzschia inconspicua]